MFHGLISGQIERVLSNYNWDSITEIRLRKGRPLVIFQGTEKIYPRSDAGQYVVTADDIEKVLGFATDFSLYAVNDRLTKGYLVKDGVRIGVGGFGVVEQGKILSIKDANTLVLRVPHEIKGCAEPLIPKICDQNKPKSTLIISPPGAGKTTMLRDIARLVSKSVNTVIIDERLEIAGANCTLDIGESEVISGVDKCLAYEFAIRTMSPDIIVTDEVFSKAEVDSVEDVTRAGVKILASIHGKDINSIKNSKVFCPLTELFEVFVTLSPIGKVESIEYK